MAACLAASVSDPMTFDSLLKTMSKEEAQQLYHRLTIRVGCFGTIFSRRDREAYDTLVWSRSQVAGLLGGDAEKTTESLRGNLGDLREPWLDNESC